MNLDDVFLFFFAIYVGGVYLGVCVLLLYYLFEAIAFLCFNWRHPQARRAVAKPKPKAKAKARQIIELTPEVTGFGTGTSSSVSSMSISSDEDPRL